MKKLILITLITILLLTACARSVPTQEQSMDGTPAVSTPTEGAPYDSDVRPVIDTYNFPSFTKDGMYKKISFSINTYLTYTDFDTMQQVFLCSAPNCTHSDDSCPAFFQNGEGKRINSVFTTYDDSALIMQTSVNDGMSFDVSVDIAQLSGADPKTIFQKENSYIEIIGVGQNNLYVMMGDDTQDFKGGVFALNIASGELTKLYETDITTMLMLRHHVYGDSIYFMYDAVGEGVYDPTDPMQTPDSREFTIERLNLQSGEVTKLYTTTLAADEYAEGEMYKGEYYFSSYENRAVVEKLDYETGETVPVGDFGVPNEFIGSTVVGYIDGYLTVVVGDEANRRNYLTHMNVETGEVTTNEFTYESGEKGGSYNVRMNIVADLGDELIVESGETLLQFEIYNEYTGEYDYPTNAIRNMAIVTQDDYFAGNMNLRPIDNSTIIAALGG